MIESPENEAAVLGSILFDRSMIPVVKKWISVDSFYRPEHRLIWEALMKIEPSAETDLVLLRNELNKVGKLKEVGGVDYLVAIAESVPSAASGEYYAKEVARVHKLRTIEGVGLQIKEFNSETVEERVAAIQDTLTGIMLENDDQPTHQEACEQAVAEYEEPITALSTGFVDLDKALIGLEPGLIVVGGATSMGKTALALSITASVCRAGKKVLYVSREMTRSQLLQRLFGMQEGIPLVSIRDRTAELGLVQAGATEVMGWDLLIDMKAGTAREVGTAMDRMGEVDLVVVDYLQLMEGDSGAGNMHLETMGVVKGLKRLGTDSLTPVLLISQLNKAVSQRPDPRPQLNDLKESGSIADCANVVMLIYRHDYYIERFGADGDLSYTADISIAKQQQGPPGCVTLHFDEKYVRFNNRKWT